MKFEYDILVIGAGHAGCEAAAAAANLGAKTCLMTIDMNKIAQMSCNPAIGGIAKGQIVREIDALGGYMGIITDRAAIQFRMLNRSKGPAMWSPRAQCDRMKFSLLWRETLENIPNLHMWQDIATELIVEEGKAVGVTTQLGAEFRAKSIIITAGTFLNGLMHVGKVMIEGGRTAEPAAKGLTESICKHGIRSDRMKTGTPVRLDRRSINLELTERQDGENDFHRFSYKNIKRDLKQRPCWMCYTNPEVHETLRSGLDDSPLYNGQIQSIGPRYCPSIETKIVTFAERDRHLLFLEPEGEDTQEIYVNGFSSSLPMETQLTALRKIPALKDAVAYRPGYAIEYDFFDPTQLKHTLESKILENLFFAGQLTGVEGYMESAMSGIIAGYNAARRIFGEEPILLPKITMMGALSQYISDESVKGFQPMGAAFGIIDPLEDRIKDKKQFRFASCFFIFSGGFYVNSCTYRHSRTKRDKEKIERPWLRDLLSQSRRATSLAYPLARRHAFVRGREQSVFVKGIRGLLRASHFSADLSRIRRGQVRMRGRMQISCRYPVQRGDSRKIRVWKI